MRQNQEVKKKKAVKEARRKEIKEILEKQSEEKREKFLLKFKKNKAKK